jgi:hypothetical protein
VLLPWNVTVHPRYFDVIKMGLEAVYARGGIGPLFLAFIPLLAFVPGKPRAIGWLLGFVGVFLLPWFFIMQYARYLLPCLAVACVPVAYCLRVAWNRGGVVRGSAATMLGISCVGAAGVLLHYSLPQVGPALGLQTGHAYLYRTLEVYPASQRINALTPPTAKVATYAEPRVFYIDREVMWADPGHHQMMRYGEMRSGADLVAGYRALGITHILLAPEMVDRLRDRDDAVRLLLLLRDAFGRGLLRVPAELGPTRLGGYVVAVVDYGRPLEAGGGR